jgi:hypothetical protein
MSPKQKKWLLIGGGIVAGICILIVISSVFLSVRGPTSSSLAPMERGAVSNTSGIAVYGGGNDAYYPEEAPAGATRDQAMPGQQAGATDASSESDNAQQTADRLIIRNGSITVAVDDTLAARKTVEDMVTQMAGDGAFVVSVNEYGSTPGADPYVDMTIRVPAAHFDEVMNQIAGMAAEGTTPTQSQSAEDVTNQYVDLDARLKSLEAARDRLQQIMAEAQTTEDLLNAEQQLTLREADIASIKGQMQYLSKSAALSSVTVSLQPYILAQPVDNNWRPAETVRRAWDSLLGSLRGFGDFLITFGIAILPWLVIFGLIIYGIVRFVMWRIRKSQAKTPQVD